MHCGAGPVALGITLSLLPPLSACSSAPTPGPSSSTSRVAEAPGVTTAAPPAAPGSAAVSAAASASAGREGSLDPALAKFLSPATPPWPGACEKDARFFVWNGQGDLRELYRAAWLVPGERDSAPMPGADATRARCVAIGPHTAFNPNNWCCRVASP